MPVRVQSLRSATKNTRPAAGTREPGEIFINWPDKQIGVIDAGKNPLDLLPIRFFSNVTDYVGGDFVINGGVGYKAKGPISAGAFNPTQWDTLATSIDLTGKEPVIAPGTTAQYWRGDKTWQTLDKAAVGLANVDNTSDANKPISTAQAAVNALKANIASPTFTGIPKADTAALGTYTTQLATTQFVGTEIGTALVSKADINSPTFLGDPRAPTPATADNDTSIATTAFVKAQGYIGPDAPNDGTQYVRKNLAWSPVSVPPGTFIGDAPPASPTNGQEWWQSSTGNMFIFYVDPGGGAGQWVQTNAAAPIAPLAGSVIDSVLGSYAANADLSVIIPVDDTIPQIGEGTQIISVSITPKSITNKLRCRFRGQASPSAAVLVAAAMFNTAANAIAATATSTGGINNMGQLTLEYEFVPGVLTAQTITIRAGPSGAGAIRFNGTSAGRAFGGVSVATLVVEEIVG